MDAPAPPKRHVPDKDSPALDAPPEASGNPCVASPPPPPATVRATVQPAPAVAVTPRAPQTPADVDAPPPPLETSTLGVEAPPIPRPHYPFGAPPPAMVDVTSTRLAMPEVARTWNDGSIGRRRLPSEPRASHSASHGRLNAGVRRSASVRYAVGGLEHWLGIGLSRPGGRRPEEARDARGGGSDSTLPCRHSRTLIAVPQAESDAGPGSAGPRNCARDPCTRFLASSSSIRCTRATSPQPEPEEEPAYSSWKMS